MEQPSKRRRLSHKNEPSLAYLKSDHGRWPQLPPGVVEEWSRQQQEPMRRGIRPPSTPRDRSSPYSGHVKSPRDESFPKFVPHGRSEEGNPKPPLKTAIASVIQVVVGLPDKPLTQLLIPPNSSIIPLDGLGTFTLDTKPSLSQFPPSTISAASLASSANSSVQSANSLVHSASSAPQPLPSQVGRNGISSISKTAEELTYITTASRSYLPTATSVELDFLGLDSQVVLLSPPSTPIPSDPSSSLLLESTGFFFPVASSISSSSGSALKSPQPTTSLPSHQSTRSAGSATSDSVSPSETGLSSTGETTRSSQISIPTTRPTSISTKSFSTTTATSSTRLPTRRTISSKRISGQSHSASTTARAKSATSSFVTSTSTHPSLTSSSFTAIASSDGGVLGGGIGGPGEPTNTSNASPPSGTPASGEETGDSGTRVATPAVIGGVVGGVAGLTIFCLVALFLLYRRRSRNKRNLIAQPQAGPVPPGSAGGDATTTERSSTAPLAAAGFFKRLRPQSGQTAATTETTPSERGFQNLGGRKLESVLLSRGDGYSEPGLSSAATAASSSGAEPRGLRRSDFGHSPGPSELETFSRSSVYRDSQGFQGGIEGDRSSSSNLRSGSSTVIYPVPPDSGLPPEGITGFGHPDEDVIYIRPSPARTPVTGGFSPLSQPPRSPRNIPSPRSPSTPISRAHRDGLGRSHPSFDGSRGSRFTEDM